MDCLVKFLKTYHRTLISQRSCWIPAEQYGGNFIKVRYADHGRVAYFCEVSHILLNLNNNLQQLLLGKGNWKQLGKQ